MYSLRGFYSAITIFAQPYTVTARVRPHTGAPSISFTLVLEYLHILRAAHYCSYTRMKTICIQSPSIFVKGRLGIPGVHSVYRKLLAEWRGGGVWCLVSSPASPPLYVFVIVTFSTSR